MTGLLRLEASVVREKGRVEIAQSLPPEEFQDCLSEHGTLLGPLSVDLVFSPRGEGVGLSGRVSGEWELECSRCLSRHRAPYGAAVEASYPAGAASLDAAEDVRQALVLAVPMQVLCRPDCKGLCPQCGGDRNAKDCGCAQPSRFRIIKKDPGPRRGG